jgi:hypothetical protein
MFLGTLTLKHQLFMPLSIPEQYILYGNLLKRRLDLPILLFEYPHSFVFCGPGVFGP